MNSRLVLRAAASTVAALVAGLGLWFGYESLSPSFLPRDLNVVVRTVMLPGETAEKVARLQFTVDVNSVQGRLVVLSQFAAAPFGQNDFSEIKQWISRVTLKSVDGSSISIPLAQAGVFVHQFSEFHPWRVWDNSFCFVTTGYLPFDFRYVQVRFQNDSIGRALSGTSSMTLQQVGEERAVGEFEVVSSGRQLFFEPTCDSPSIQQATAINLGSSDRLNDPFEVYFGLGSFNLTPSVYDVLQTVAKELKGNSNLMLVVEGYSDSFERDNVLSARRAKAVADALSSIVPPGTKVVIDVPRKLETVVGDGTKEPLNRVVRILFAQESSLFLPRQTAKKVAITGR